MALIYESGWELAGKKEQLTPGYHYKKKVRSMTVPEGQVVRFYVNQDRTGGHSRPFYEGTYHDLSFYDNVTQTPGVIHIEKTGLTRRDMVEAQWGIGFPGGLYMMAVKIPVGERVHGEDFPNDKVSHLYIPFGMTVECFDNTEGKGSLIFSGNKADGLSFVDLNDYGYDQKVSRMVVSLDDWEPAGIELRNEKIVESVGEKLGGTGEIGNNHPTNSASLTKEIEVTREKTTETNWSVEGGVSASLGFEAGYEGGTVAKATGNIEISFSAGYGESKSVAESTRTMDSVTVEVGPMTTSKISMWVDYGKMEADAIRKLRNTRTGAIIEQAGKISIDYATKTRAEVH